MPHILNFRRHMQKGSILVQFALTFMVLVVILGILQVGYMYAIKRDLQRIADMAALESTHAENCADAAIAGINSISKQWPIGVTPADDFSTMLECGNWTTNSGFTSGMSENGTFNAIRSTLTGQTLQLIPFTERWITSTATAAKRNPIASFSVGSGVAQMNDGALNNLLSMLLGTKVDLSLADYQGLANTQINLLGIKNAVDLTAGTYEELLDTRIALGTLIDTSIDLAKKSQNATADVAITALNEILKLSGTLDLTNTFISLLKDTRPNGTQKGLLDIGLHRDNPSTALNADVSALDLLLVSLQVANKDSALKLPAGLNLGPLAKLTLEAKVIEPPVIATGRGKDANGKYWAQAHTGQVRVAINLGAVMLESLLPTINVLELIKIKIGTTEGGLINLPIYAEVGSADARLESVICNAQPRTHHAYIETKPGLAYVLLGKSPQAMQNYSVPLKDLPSDSFSLLGLKLEISALFGLTQVIADAKISTKVELPIDVPDYERLGPYKFSTDPLNPTPKSELTLRAGSEKKLGASLGNALKDPKNIQILSSDDLKITVKVPLLPDITIPAGAILGPVLEAVLKPLLPLLGSTLASLDSVLAPLLQALGLQLGYADTGLIWTDCNSAQLVY